MVPKDSEFLLALSCPKRVAWRLQGLICVALLFCASAPDLLAEELDVEALRKSSWSSRVETSIKAGAAFSPDGFEQLLKAWSDGALRVREADFPAEKTPYETTGDYRARIRDQSNPKLATDLRQYYRELAAGNLVLVTFPVDRVVYHATSQTATLEVDPVRLPLYNGRSLISCRVGDLFWMETKSSQNRPYRRLRFFPKPTSILTVEKGKAQSFAIVDGKGELRVAFSLTYTDALVPSLVLETAEWWIDDQKVWSASEATARSKTVRLNREICHGGREIFSYP